MSVLRWPYALLPRRQIARGGRCHFALDQAAGGKSRRSSGRPATPPTFDLAQSAAAPGPLPKGLAPEDFPMRKAPSLSISPEKIFFIVAKSRQSDGTATELDANSTSADDDAVHGFEDHSRMTDRSELSGFIRGLNVDEQVDLVALMWLGRGDGDL